MDLSLATRPGRGCVVVQVSGVVDLAAVPHVRRLLQDAMDAGAHTVVLDLPGVRLIDSTGLGMIVWLHKELHERGGRVRLAAPQPAVLRLLELTSMDRLIRIYGSVEAAEDDVRAVGEG